MEGRVRFGMMVAWCGRRYVLRLESVECCCVVFITLRCGYFFAYLQRQVFVDREGRCLSNPLPPVFHLSTRTLRDGVVVLFLLKKAQKGWREEWTGLDWTGPL